MRDPDWALVVLTLVLVVGGPGVPEAPRGPWPRAAGRNAASMDREVDRVTTDGAGGTAGIA